MIRVLHLRTTDRVCGPGKTILESCKRIDQGSFELTIGLLTNMPASENEFWQAATEQGIPIVPIQSRSRLDFGQIRKIVSTIISRKIDIVHSHEYKSDILGFVAAKITKKPIVTTAHGWISNSARSRIYLWLSKRLLRCFDRVLAVSPKIESELLSLKLKRHKVDLVYNAIVAEDFSASMAEAGYLRRRFSIPEPVKIVGIIGRLSHEKNQSDFIRVAESVLEKVSEVSFIIAGEGPDLLKLKKIVAEKSLHQKVHFAGHVSKVKAVYKDLDVLVLTSLSEGFPNVILEALCMGVPVVATDVGGVSDIIVDGETGFLTEVNNIQQLSAGVIRLLQSDQIGATQVDNGRDLIGSRFEFDHRMRIVEAIYRDLLFGSQRV